MQVRVVKRQSKEISAFSAREWPKADREHYGNVARWHEDTFRIVAREHKKIVGVLQLSIRRGVCEIKALIVSKESRGLGVGTALMQRAEEIARKEGAHKIWLETGKGWKAEPFYKKLGYRKNTILRKHYFGKDFVLFEKLLK